MPLLRNVKGREERQFTQQVEQRAPTLGAQAAGPSSLIGPSGERQSGFLGGILSGVVSAFAGDQLQKAAGAGLDAITKTDTEKAVGLPEETLNNLEGFRSIDFDDRTQKLLDMIDEQGDGTPTSQLGPTPQAGPRLDGGKLDFTGLLSQQTGPTTEGAFGSVFGGQRVAQNQAAPADVLALVADADTNRRRQGTLSGLAQNFITSYISAGLGGSGGSA